MVLLKQERNNETDRGLLFTFHYGSSQTHPANRQNHRRPHLHSTMVLLKQELFGFVMLILYIFTFHYGSSQTF